MITVPDRGRTNRQRFQLARGGGVLDLQTPYPDLDFLTVGVAELLY